MNYYQEYEKQIEVVSQKDDKPSLLLHACCCPCSSHCLEVLTDYFDVTVFFYNPNIDELEEYDKRLQELERFTREAPFARGVRIVAGRYEPEVFYEMARGREMLPERGERCYDCYRLRMEESYKYALEHQFDYFSTTLSISPYKNAEWLNEIGMELERKNRDHSDDEKIPVFLFTDFKKRDGYKRSIELSREYNLYRQDYCGCIFSRRDRRDSH